jgi:hypothetical protein
LAVCLPSLTLPVAVRARSMTPEPSPARGGCSCERRAPLTRLAEGPRWNVRLGTDHRRPEAPSVVPGGCEVFVRRSNLPTRLSTRGEQCRAPCHSLRSATPMSKVPRRSPSWLARRGPLEPTLSGDPGRFRPTDATHFVKDEHPCTGSQQRVSGRTGSDCRARCFNGTGPLLPAILADASRVLDSTRRARRWCLASRHRPKERRARARSCRVGRPRPLPSPKH